MNPSAPRGTRVRSLPRRQWTRSIDRSSRSAGPSTVSVTPLSRPNVIRPERRTRRPAASKSPSDGLWPSPGSHSAPASWITTANPRASPSVGGSPARVGPATTRLPGAARRPLPREQAGQQERHGHGDPPSPGLGHADELPGSLIPESRTGPGPDGLTRRLGSSPVGPGHWTMSRTSPIGSTVAARTAC